MIRSSACPLRQADPAQSGRHGDRISYTTSRDIIVRGLKIAEENQLLSGSGVGPNIHGIVPQATAFNTALMKANDPSDPYAVLRRAILQVRLAEHRASGILLHPTVAADLDLVQDGEQRYFVSPATGTNGVAWRLPIVESTAIDETEFVVADWTAAQIFDRQQATIEFDDVPRGGVAYAIAVPSGLCRISLPQRAG